MRLVAASRPNPGPFHITKSQSHLSLPKTWPARQIHLPIGSSRSSEILHRVNVEFAIPAKLTEKRQVSRLSQCQLGSALNLCG